MEASMHTHRALTAGLSAGAGLAISAAAFAATMPFERVHSVIGSAAVPFAVGSVAGVGLFAIGLGIADIATAHRDEGYQAKVRKANADAEAYRRSRQRTAAPKGVPVIARASDALSEEEAWADIDELLRSDSPVSCDPARSKDIYEIALEEMSAGAAASSSAHAAYATSTATEPVVDPFAYTPQPDDAYGVWASQASADVTSQIYAQAPADVTASTHTPSGVVAGQGFQQAAQAADSTNVYMAAAGYQAAAPSPQAAGFDLDLDEPSMDYFSEVPVAPAAEAVAEPAVASVPMADYSGHEDMWAAALAILAEPDDAGATAFASTANLGNTDPLAATRMSAFAEGAQQTGRHTRVNEILEEEFERVPSQSVRRTSREYLRVIQGGTQALPRMTVEA